MTDMFTEVRNRVPAQEAARRFGLEFDRKGWCKCPFHHDRHASMSFKDGRWRCWVCNEGGDSIDLTAKLYDLKPLEAVERLNREFSLGLDIRGQPTAEEQPEVRRQRELRQTHEQFEQWRKETINRLSRCFRIGHFALRDIKTQEDWDGLTEAQLLAIRDQARFEYQFELLLGGTPEEQMQLFRDRKGIFLRTEQILNPTQKKSAAV